MFLFGFIVGGIVGMFLMILIIGGTNGGSNN